MSDPRPDPKPAELARLRLLAEIGLHRERDVRAFLRYLRDTETNVTLGLGAYAGWSEPDRARYVKELQASYCGAAIVASKVGISDV